MHIENIWDTSAPTNKTRDYQGAVDPSMDHITSVIYIKSLLINLGNYKDLFSYGNSTQEVTYSYNKPLLLRKCCKSFLDEVGEIFSSNSTFCIKIFSF